MRLHTAASALAFALSSPRPRTSPPVASSSSSVFGQPSDVAQKLIEDALDAGEHGARRDGSKLLLIHADFCPFANRAWIAALEKEPDPDSPTLFSELHSCYWMGEKDPGTAVLYELGLKTLPAAVYDGKILSESALVADMIDDVLAGPPLKPADPLMRFNMNRFREQHAGLVDAFYSLLRAQSEQKRTEHRNTLLAQLATLDANLAKFDGPFLCGEQFTLADIEVVGFVERVIDVLSHYQSFEIPPEMGALLAWWQAVRARPSVRVVRARRSALSVATQAFEGLEREAYLQEIYETYAADDLPVCRREQAEAGRPRHNAYRRLKQRQRKELYQRFKEAQRQKDVKEA